MTLGPGDANLFQKGQGQQGTCIREGMNRRRLRNFLHHAYDRVSGGIEKVCNLFWLLSFLYLRGYIGA